MHVLIAVQGVVKTHGGEGGKVQCVVKTHGGGGGEVQSGTESVCELVVRICKLVSCGTSPLRRRGDRREKSSNQA